MDRNIMVIDDASAIRKALAFSLSAEGFTVIEAENGRAALEKLGDRPVDLFICDINMPVMDGMAFLKTVKSDDRFSRYRSTPVIMLTTESGLDRKEEGRAAGARAWMVKPFKPEKLLQAIRDILGQLQ